MTVSNEVILDSKLFHQNERVLLNLFFACKLQRREAKSLHYRD